MIPDGADQVSRAQIPQTHGLRDHILDDDVCRKYLTSSSPAEASTEAPGQKAAVLTAAPLGWTRLASSDPVLASQRREVPSVEAEQSRVPPGDNDTALTLYL